MSKRRHHQERRHDRREQFTAAPRRQDVSINTVIIAGALILVAVVIFVSRTGSGGAGAVAEFVSSAAAVVEAAPRGQDVVLPAGQFDDGVARFYRYTTGSNREIRFFVMKSSDGVVRAAFDSCDVCYRERRGYRQSGDAMICNNCSRSFRSVDINVLQGGCNPAPLTRTVENGNVVVKAASLESGTFYF